MATTAENFRSLLGPTATERMVQLAATAVDTLEAAGVDKAVVDLVVDGIAALDAHQYEYRSQTIEELKTAVQSGRGRPGECEEGQG